MRPWIWFFGFLVFAVALGHFRSYLTATPTDFRTFYCAGKVVLERGDPYRAEPLFACERTIAASEGGALVTLTPAPLPSYDFIGLALLAALPVNVARIVYVLLVLGALAAVAYRLSRIAAIPVPLSFAVAFFGIAYEAVGFGQIAPIAIAAIALAVVSLREDKPRAAAVWLAIAMIQPQFALPALLGLAIFVKGSRVVAAAAVAVLAVFALVADGTRGLRDYPAVVSLQARAEIAAPTQYSLTWLLHAAGVHARPALDAGAVWYVVFTLAGLGLLLRNRAAAVSTGAVIFVPALVAVFGGTYVHVYQLEIGVVAAIVLASRSPMDIWLSLALGSLIVPFAPLNDVLGLSFLPAAALAVATTWLAISYLSRDSSRRVAMLRASLASAIVASYFAGCAIARHRIVIPLASAHTVSYDPSAFASLEYAHYAATLAPPAPLAIAFFVLVKLPLWFALGVIIWKWLALVLRPVPKSHFAT